MSPRLGPRSEAILPRQGVHPWPDAPGKYRRGRFPLVRGEAVMRRVWAALFGIPIAVGLAVEIVALGKPKPADPRRDGTATAFLKWASGVEPKHWRRFVLVPPLWLVCLWLPPHVSLGLGPSLRWGRGRRARQ